MKADDLDQPAKAFWIPGDIISEHFSRGDDRHFVSLRAAILFVMEELPSFERGTASIHIDDSPGRYGIEEIQEIYKSAEFKGPRLRAAIRP